VLPLPFDLAQELETAAVHPDRVPEAGHDHLVEMGHVVGLQEGRELGLADPPLLPEPMDVVRDRLERHTLDRRLVHAHPLRVTRGHRWEPAGT
jgi:hypothetical protein